MLFIALFSTERNAKMNLVLWDEFRTYSDVLVRFGMVHYRLAFSEIYYRMGQTKVGYFQKLNPFQDNICST